MGKEPLVIVEKLVNGRWCYVIGGESRREDSEREAWQQAHKRLVESMGDVEAKLAALGDEGRAKGGRAVSAPALDAEAGR